MSLQLSASFQGDQSSAAEYAALVQELGRKGMDEHSDYYSLMERLIKSNPDLGELIGQCKCHVGNGWNTKMVYSYGLTHAGIQKVLQIKKIDAVVASTSKNLRNFFSKLGVGETRACVTDSSLLHGEDDLSHHAVAVLAERSFGKMRVVILDSDAGSYSESQLRKMMPCLISFELLQSGVKRQPNGSMSCYAFAISDCAALQTHPNLIQEIANLNKGIISKLPDSLLELTAKDKARDKSLEYQGLLLGREKLSEETSRRASFCQRIGRYFKG